MRDDSSRRGVRVVEGARLERVYSRKVIQGSNPCLSAIQNDLSCSGRVILYCVIERMRTLLERGKAEREGLR